MGPRLELLMEYHATLKTPVEVGPGPFGSSEYGELYFFTQPRFESGDPRYGAWLNRIFAIAQGKLGPSLVDYPIYQVG